MSRSGYSDDCDGWALIRWRGAVNAAIKGKRGQAMLRELLAALDEMPEKRLTSGALVTQEGECCALGALGQARGMDLRAIDPEDAHTVAQAFGIARALAAEIMFENDGWSDLDSDRIYTNFDVCGPMRPWESHRQLRWTTDPKAAAARWGRMRAWVQSQLNDAAT